MPNKLLQSLWILAIVLAAACTPWPNPAPLLAFLAQAEPLIAERRYSEAIVILEQAAQAHPEDPVPLIKMGQIYLNQQRWLLAEDAFNRALARDLHHPLALAGLAEALLNQAELRDALKLWQETVRLNPDLPGGFTGLGRTYLALFNFEAAEDAFLKQQTHAPDPEAQWHLAALTAPHDLASATNYLHAISSSPSAQETAAETPPAQTVRAGLLVRRDYLLAALVPFSPESPPAEIARATGIALAQIEMWPLAAHALTVAHEKQTTELKPADAETLAFLGYALAQAGRPALDLFEQAQNADPESALPLYFQGIYLRQKGALKAAEALFKQALSLDPENAAIYAELGHTKAQQGNFAAAEAGYLAAHEVAADDPEFQMLLAQFYASRAYRLAEAGIPTVETIIKADENNAEAHDLLGWMRFLSGAPGGGEAAFRRALELDPDLVSARYHLARQLEVNDQTALAISEYRRVIDWDRSGHFRERALKDLQRLGVLTP